jgi:hypothetical protein
LETTRQTRSGSQSQSTSDSTTVGDTSSYSEGRSTSRRPILHFRTSKQTSTGYSHSHATSRSRGTSDSTTEGWSDGIHKRSLLNPDEIGRMLARVDDRSRAGHPGLVLALIPGEHPLLARRVNYFESQRFLGYFDPHPHHPPPPTLAELARLANLAAQGTAQLLQLPQQRAPKKHGWEGIAGLVAIVVIAGGSWLYQHAGALFSSSGSRTPISYGSVAPSPSPTVTAAYAQGVADFRAQQAWFAAQTGDRSEGAQYWAANRNQPDHDSCDEAAEDYSGNARANALFAAGCKDAKRWLDPIDQNRANPQYWAGFNDEARRSGN